MTDLDQLRANLDAARVAKDANPCAATREAFKLAWQALEDATPRRKPSVTRGNRAGRRQAAERKAMTDAAILAAARRR